MVRTILNQMLLMFCIMIVGYVAYKKNLINDEGSKTITNILLYLCMPCIMINVFNIPFEVSKLNDLLTTGLITFYVTMIGIIISKMIFRKNGIEVFAASFSNAGFIGIPIISGILGDSYLFYITSYIIVTNIMSWSIGIYQITNDKENLKIKNVILNPAFIGVMIGLFLFVLQINLPGFMTESIRNIASLNTPLAMLLLGAYLSKNNILKVIKNKRAYFVCFIKLIVVPIVTINSLFFLSNSINDIVAVIIIAVSTPTASLTALLAQQFGGDYEYGAELISLSTVLSIITIPIVIFVAEATGMFSM